MTPDTRLATPAELIAAFGAKPPNGESINRTFFHKWPD